MAHPTRRYSLVRGETLSPQVRRYIFSTEDALPLTFIPGQFLTLHVPGPEKIAHRSYSIANPPGSHLVEITCAYIAGGLASEYLAGLAVGDCIEATGPHGLLVLKEEQPQRIFLVGTGTGIAPYRSMLPQISERLTERTDLSVILVQGNRTAADLLFADDFLAFDRQHAHFQFYACYSRATHTQHPFEHLGRVQKVLEKLELNPSQDLVYLCGNPDMIDENFALLTAMGFDRKNIRREKYSFSH